MDFKQKNYEIHRIIADFLEATEKTERNDENNWIKDEIIITTMKSEIINISTSTLVGIEEKSANDEKMWSLEENSVKEEYNAINGNGVAKKEGSAENKNGGKNMRKDDLFNEFEKNISVVVQWLENKREYDRRQRMRNELILGPGVYIKDKREKIQEYNHECDISKGNKKSNVMGKAYTQFNESKGAIPKKTRSCNTNNELDEICKFIWTSKAKLDRKYEGSTGPQDGQGRGP